MTRRVAAALNNVIAAHAFIAADGRTREIRAELDTYYTTFTLAEVPRDWPQMTSEALLHSMDRLTFKTDIGKHRVHKIGIGSADDMTARPFDSTTLELWMTAIQSEVEFDTHQRLLLSALRRLRRREFVLAVIDAATAVEVCISDAIRRMMQARGASEQQIDDVFENAPRLQQQLTQMDRLRLSLDQSVDRFEHSTVCRTWKTELAELRHNIVHRGQREVTEDLCLTALRAGVAATIWIEQAMPPHTMTGMRWNETFIGTPDKPPPGKLRRFFDA
jgi:hypothetical protein